MDFRPLVCLLVLGLLVLGGCAIEHPCADGGDITWPNAIRANKTCYQKELKDGRVVNDGKFVERYENGKVALEGEFIEGRKNGIWTQYDVNGLKVMEKYFEYGVEKTAPPTPASK